MVSSERHQRGKRNCQSSEAKFSAVGFEPSRDRPVTSPSQRSNPLGHRAPPKNVNVTSSGYTFLEENKIFVKKQKEIVA